jgi:hypothetical protein
MFIALSLTVDRARSNLPMFTDILGTREENHLEIHVMAISSKFDTSK